MCALTGAGLGLGHLPGAVWLYAFAGILDVLDGRLARVGNQQSAAGALFDSVSDRWGELFAFAGLRVVPPRLVVAARRDGARSAAR